MANNTYLIVEGKKINVSDVVNNQNISPALGIVKGTPLSVIIDRLAREVQKGTIHILQGEGINISGNGSGINPYRISIVPNTEIIEPQSLVGRYLTTGGEKQTISIGEGLVLDVNTGILSVNSNILTAAGDMQKSQYDSDNDGIVDNSKKLEGFSLSEILGKTRFIYTQSQASSTWVIWHGLNSYPNVTIVNSAGDQMYADVHYDSINQLTINFIAANGGSVYLS